MFTLRNLKFKVFNHTDHIMENEEDENLVIGKYMTKLQKKSVETLNIAKELI